MGQPVVIQTRKLPPQATPTEGAPTSSTPATGPQPVFGGGEHHSESPFQSDTGMRSKSVLGIDWTSPVGASPTAPPATSTTTPPATSTTTPPATSTTTPPATSTTTPPATSTTTPPATSTTTPPATSTTTPPATSTTTPPATSTTTPPATSTTTPPATTTTTPPSTTPAPSGPQQVFGGGVENGDIYGGQGYIDPNAAGNVEDFFGGTTEPQMAFGDPYSPPPTYTTPTTGAPISPSSAPITSGAPVPSATAAPATASAAPTTPLFFIPGIGPIVIPTTTTYPPPGSQLHQLYNSDFYSEGQNIEDSFGDYKGGYYQHNPNSHDLFSDGPHNFGDVVPFYRPDTGGNYPSIGGVGDNKSTTNIGSQHKELPAIGIPAGM